MPQACIIMTNSGGAGTGLGARSLVPWTNTRIDIRCYAHTTYETTQIHWEVYRALMAVGRQLVGATLVYDFVVTGGPINNRDPDTDWPFTMSVFDMSSAYTI